MDSLSDGAEAPTSARAFPDLQGRTDGYFRAIVDSLPVAICRWLPDTTLTYVNQPYRDAVAGGAEVLHRSWLEFVPEEDREQVSAVAREVVLDLRTLTYSHAVTDASGKKRIFQWTDQPILDEDGNVVEVQSVGMDITPQWEAEAERERLEKELRRTHRMEAVGRLAGGIAHDFNNMLGVILGRAELALGAESGPEGRREDLLEIRDAAERSMELTQQLLTYARRQPIAPVPTDLNARVAGVMKMLARLIGEDIALRFEPDPALWRIRVDLSQLDQVVLNLAVNARDAIAAAEHELPETARKELTIRTRNARVGVRPASAKARPDPEDPAAGEYAVLSVSDSGSGMDEATLERLFEPFFTTKPVGSGTGLGLAMVYGMVKQNGGFVEVQTAPRAGTTFELFFPRSFAEDTSEPTAPSALPVENGSETVLVLEDEPGVLRVARRFLERMGYTVLTAEALPDALEVARGHEGRVDLLLTDVVLPGANGRIAAERLTAEFPGLRTLFMSGYPADVITRQGLLPGHVRFLQKPFSQEALGREVRAALDAE